MDLKIVIYISLLVLIGCHKPIFKERIPIIFGIDNFELKVIANFDEFGGFGEGYTFEIYEVSEGGIQAFINLKVKEISQYKDDSSWKKVDWELAPADKLNEEVLIMCLNYANGNSKLKMFLTDAKKALQKEETYYSFYYKPNLENPQDVQLFIIDVRQKKLYVIESNF